MGTVPKHIITEQDGLDFAADCILLFPTEGLDGLAAKINELEPSDLKMAYKALFMKHVSLLVLTYRDPNKPL